MLKNKKKLAAVLAVAFCITMAFTACDSKESKEVKTESPAMETTPKMAPSMPDTSNLDTTSNPKPLRPGN